MRWRRLPWAVLLLASAPLQAAPDASWVTRLQAQLAAVAARHQAQIGVYVRDLDSGVATSFQADEAWYLASTVKVPVAITVLRGVERGDFGLDTPLTLRAADVVDGAGPTRHQPVGKPLTVRYLLEQMIVWSDNTATDMLIGLVGIGAVNALVQELVPDGIGRITSLADVRRQVYRQLTPEALHLQGSDFVLLKQQRNDSERRLALARLLDVPPQQLRLASIGQAYDAYYATGLNSGRLDAYGELLAQLVEGKALGPVGTAWLLKVMERVKTGPNRIKAGLPLRTRFAHKTGTQRARTCDSGVISVPRLGKDTRVIVAACTRGELSVTRSDQALRDVGAAICQSGLLTDGRPHDPMCQQLPRLSSDAASGGPDAVDQP
ncbi:class A beta-lactamase-related serine hydrolase [Aquincola tertiaricarbonis]|uniref:Class A beta-lactamase-related serine hydrolase n=1 Tax=Aquincola tertiaricarbonis TaxID=391953 RepID=A0ABY4S8J6_AQUTE|nr:serine hydrolase [Aquincola tertiaricarbonis]URI07574.1 class A beta-lactamase-related serine hydrolase [Aquincola tertiaricarbonis]